MLSFSKGVILESLTYAPPGRDPDEYENTSRQNFRNLLVCMGDRGAQACQRTASEDAVVALLRSDPGMSQEVYLQLMKQLIMNPSPRSVQSGWRLLNRLCQQSPPKDELAEFVRSFIMETGRNEDGNEKLLTMAQTCLTALDAPDRQEGEEELLRTLAEIDSITAENDELLNEVARLTEEGGSGGPEMPAPEIKAYVEQSRNIAKKLYQQIESKNNYIKAITKNTATQNAKVDFLMRQNALQSEKIREAANELAHLSVSIARENTMNAFSRRS